MRTTSYRYPSEHLILAVTFLLVLGVIALTATATVCASGIFILAFVVLSYNFGLSHHRQLVRAARRVTPEETPELAELVERGTRRLGPGPVEAYVLPSRELNAYTFGLGSPKVVVLYSPLLKVMDEDELMFILGHELGHVALGHTWLNSLVGGLAGVPSPFSAAALMALAFLWWNRACEFSADRAGLLACGKPHKAVSALVKLAAGPQAADPRSLELAYRQIDAQDDDFLSGLNDLLATHPMLIRRIEHLKEYAASQPYRRLQEQLDRKG
jgi:Zn-dependent protease with chaperone function